MSTVYDVTTWTIPGDPNTTAYTDIGKVINSIIADIKSQQNNQSSRPGAVIYIPPGHFSLKTRVVVDISYLQIKGSGHGFTSLGIRYNTGNTSSWWEIWPGASHVKVEKTDGNGDAFLVSRAGDPRISSVQFRDFCIDGVDYTPNHDSFTNGKVGIRIASDNDGIKVSGMGFTYLERALVNHGADAFDVSDNFMVECGSCVELTGASQASKINNNFIGAGWIGYSIFAEGADGLLISGNNIFPIGKSIVHLKNCQRSAITANKFKNYYPGMIDMEGTNNSNLIASNQFRRELSPGSPPGNGKDDLYGLIHVRGSNNMVTTNLFDYNVPAASVTPSGATPTIVLVASGSSNFISNNHTVSNIAVKTVVLDASTTGTKVLDSGSSSQVQSFTTNYTLRPTP